MRMVRRAPLLALALLNAVRLGTGVEDECAEGWAGEDCDECAPGFSGELCERRVPAHEAEACASVWHFSGVSKAAAPAPVSEPKTYRTLLARRWSVAICWIGLLGGAESTQTGWSLLVPPGRLQS